MADRNPGVLRALVRVLHTLVGALLALARGAASRAHGLPAFALCAVASLAQAQIDVVASERGGAYAEAYAALAERLSGFEPRLRDPSEHRAGGRAGNDVVVTLGAEALRAAIATGDTTTVIAALIPRASFERLREEQRAALGRRPITAVFLDQPAARQIALVRATTPAFKRIAVLASDEASLVELRRAARDGGIELVVETVGSPQELQSQLRRALAGADALLATPDAKLYNATTLPQVLLTTFRMGKPVFGFAAGTVRAGALATTYSTPAHIGQQAAAAARRALSGQSLPAPAPAQRFDVIVNHTVARGLGLAVDAEEALAKRVERLEGQP